MKNSIILLALLGLSGCKDQPEQIPAYLTIEPFTVNAQGDASWHKITDAWVYVNGEYLGAYTLPATVPFLVDGPGEVWLYPGVKENGILASPNIYPELTRWESSSVQFNPGETTVVKPDTRYDQAAVFPLASVAAILMAAPVSLLKTAMMTMPPVFPSPRTAHLQASVSSCR